MANHGHEHFPVGHSIASSWSRDRILLRHMDRANMNGRHQVTITYRGDGGREYKDELDLDLDVFLEMHFIGRRGLHDIHKQLEDIAGTLQNFKAWGGGLRQSRRGTWRRKKGNSCKRWKSNVGNRRRRHQPALSQRAVPRTN